MRIFRVAVLLAFFCSSVAPFYAQPGRSPNKWLALTGGTIYQTPDSPAIPNGVVLIHNHRIVAVGKRDDVAMPRATRVIDCTGMFLFAGFWNSHVHFSETKWENAAGIPAPKLTQSLQETFSRYGFTSVFDLGSPIENTQLIRKRIEQGSVDGPRILTTGTGLVPEGGTPFYVKPLRFPEVLSPTQAVSLVRSMMNRKPDGVKVFTGPTPVEGGPPLIMRLELVRAITQEAHRHRKLVFAHPENDAGVAAAVDGGVDILAHTAPTGSRWTAAKVMELKAANVTLIPTLSLFTKLGRSLGLPPPVVERLIGTPLEQLRAFSVGGGRVMFGTDLGFIPDYSPQEEYVLMQRAGMSFRGILASLTTNPSARFGLGQRVGIIRPHMDADIVVTQGDPTSNIGNLANVKYTIRLGRVIYESK